MPIYPALALLLGCAMAVDEDSWIRRGTRAFAVIMGICAVAAAAILFAVRNVSAPGDISQVLAHQTTYRLSLSHMLDLTLPSFAYLRFPLALAAIAFGVAAAGTIIWRGHRAFIVIALAMVIFFQAARLAMVKFDPYLSSRGLAEALERSPEGTLITNGHYYPFSSIFFYTNRTALLLNGRSYNLMYGSYAPGAPNVFIDDAQFHELWLRSQRYYLAAQDSLLPHLNQLVGANDLFVVAASGGKSLLTNHPLPSSQTE